jgi:glycosyltransferase involved in cell wall biosynthesis
MTRIRSVYPHIRAGAVDAIDAYNRLLVEAFGRIDGIDAATCSPTELRGGACDALLIQYNPFSYGRWGIAPSLVMRLARARLRAGRPHVCLVVHEPYVAARGPRTTVMAAWQRVQLLALACLADSVVVPSTDAARRVGRRLCRPMVVPVGSNLPDRRSCREETRTALQVQPHDVVLVVFGASTAGRSLAHTSAAVRAAADCGKGVVLLVLGSGHDLPEHLEGIVVHRPGALPAEDVSRLIAAGDLFLAPYDDGVSTRRGALMAALQHGIAVVGTTAGRSDPTLVGSSALHLVTIGDVAAFAEEVARLTADETQRRASGAAARRLYVECFDWDVIARQLLPIIRAAR